MPHTPLHHLQLHLQRFTLLALLLAVAGCGRISFISDRYDNFTAYYNTFYNAERSFREGVENLEETDERIDRQVYLSIFDAPGQSTNDQRFQAAIDKSADVLREHPESKWIDDALLLIGKSYFFQNNFVGAEQKFREVIALASALEDEARLWLARTLIAAGAHDDAREHLLVSLNREDLSARWEPSLRLALGELHVKRSDYGAAIEELVAGLEEVRDNRYRSRAAFLLGQVYESVGRYEDAVEAYRRVLHAHPRYELSYAAQYSAVRVQGMHVDADEALSTLRRMERDDKNYSNRHELAFLRGRIYQSEQYAGDARALYHDILYDSDGQITEIRGRVHYALGELYRDAYRDYQTASAHFDTASTALRSPTPAPGSGRAAPIDYAPEAIVDADEKAEMFGTFAAARTQLAEMDSLLYLGSLDEHAFAAKILEIRRQLAEEMAEEERRAARLQAQRGFQDAAAASDANRNTGGSDAATTGSGGAGFLFHQDPVRVQEGRMNFLNIWGDRPLAPNWRRIEAVRAVAALTDSVGMLRGQRLTDVDQGVGDSPLPPIDYSNVPRDSLNRAAMRARRAAARYELANVLFLSMNEPDSAAFWYRTVIDEDSDFQVAQRAFYALAEVHSSLGDSASARRLYEQVLEDYPSSDFAGRVRERLGIRQDVPSDTLSMAEEDYDREFRLWQRGSYQRALDGMVAVAASYPHMEVAPRALLAAGQIYLEWAQRDSLDIFGPLPLRVSDATLDRSGLLDVAIADPTASDTLIEDNAAPAGQAEGSAAPSENADWQEPRLEDPTPDDAPPGASDLDQAQPDAAPDGEAAADDLLDDAAPPPPVRRTDELVDDAPPVRRVDTSDRDALADSLNVEDGSASPRGDSTADADAAAMPDAEGKDDVLTVTDDDSTTVPDTDSAMAIRGDSTMVDRGDSTMVDRGDSTMADRGDSTMAIRGDSTMIIRGDSAMAIRGDSTMADRRDSARVVRGDSAMVVHSDSAASAATDVEIDEKSVYLKTLYAGVQQKYPETRYATRASRLLNALSERESELKAAADSVAALQIAAADSAAALAGAGLIATDSLDIASDSAAISSDSLTSASDSTVVAPPADTSDSPAVVSDSTAIASDSTALASDSPALASETTAVVSDSVAIATDSLAIAADSLAIATDSLAVASESLDRASDLRSGTDSVSTATEIVTDATDAAAKPDTTNDAQVGPPQIPEGEDAMRGEGGIVPELGGYTLVIGSDTKQATMRALADKYAAQGFRTDVIVDRASDEIVYRAAIGHFATQRAAGELMQKYVSQINETVQLAPLADFE